MRRYFRTVSTSAWNCVVIQNLASVVFHCDNVTELIGSARSSAQLQLSADICGVSEAWETAIDQEGQSVAAAENRKPLLELILSMGITEGQSFAFMICLRGGVPRGICAVHVGIASPLRSMLSRGRRFSQDNPLQIL